MSRSTIPLAGFFVTALLLAAPAQQQEEPTKSAFETNSKKWDDLPIDAAQWKRVGIPVKAKPNAKNPWHFAEAGIILATASPAPEILLFDKVQTNGVLHFEWRVKKGDTKATCGVYVRTAVDGSLWHLATSGPKGGAITALTKNSDGKQIRLTDPKTTQQTKKGYLKDPGEWNVTEVTAKDKTLSIWTNGFVIAEWPFCDVPKGYFGFRAEPSQIEYRNLKFKRIR
jgi:hypothetical protein